MKTKNSITTYALYNEAWTHLVFILILVSFRAEVLICILTSQSQPARTRPEGGSRATSLSPQPSLCLQEDYRGEGRNPPKQKAIYIQDGNIYLKILRKGIWEARTPLQRAWRQREVPVWVGWTFSGCLHQPPHCGIYCCQRSSLHPPSEERCLMLCSGECHSWALRSKQRRESHLFSCHRVLLFCF